MDDGEGASDMEGVYDGEGMDDGEGASDMEGVYDGQVMDDGEGTQGVSRYVMFSHRIYVGVDDKPMKWFQQNCWQFGLFFQT